MASTIKVFVVAISIALSIVISAQTASSDKCDEVCTGIGLEHDEVVMYITKIVAEINDGRREKCTGIRQAIGLYSPIEEKFSKCDVCRGEMRRMSQGVASYGRELRAHLRGCVAVGR